MRSQWTGLTANPQSWEACELECSGVKQNMSYLCGMGSGSTGPVACSQPMSTVCARAFPRTSHRLLLPLFFNPFSPPSSFFLFSPLHRHPLCSCHPLTWIKYPCFLFAPLPHITSLFLSSSIHLVRGLGGWPPFLAFCSVVNARPYGFILLLPNWTGASSFIAIWCLSFWEQIYVFYPLLSCLLLENVCYLVTATITRPVTHSLSCTKYASAI